MDNVMNGPHKYSVVRFLIALDLYDAFRLVVDSFFFIGNNTIIYFLINLYNLFVGFLSMVGFNFVGEVDYFSFNMLPEIHPFVHNSYDAVVYSNHDFQEYNSTFFERARNKIGRIRRFYMRKNK